MNTEQKAVILDYAQELQTNCQPWHRFEFQDVDGRWYPCSEQTNPIRSDYRPSFRRRPMTITVTMQKPIEARYHAEGQHWITLQFKDEAAGIAALAAIRAEMEKVK